MRIRKILFIGWFLCEETFLCEGSIFRTSAKRKRKKKKYTWGFKSLLSNETLRD